MTFSTTKQREAARLALKLLSQEPMTRPRLTAKLAHRENGVYERTSDAKQVVKKLEKNDYYPVTLNGNKLYRTDIVEKKESEVNA